MPLTNVSLLKGSRTAAQKSAILDEIYQAMRETFGVPQDDKFMMITEHPREDFLFGRHFMNIDRSDDLIIIQLTVSDTRSVDQKKALFARIARAWPAKSASVPKTFLSTWSRQGLRTGRSVMASRNMPTGNRSPFDPNRTGSRSTCRLARQRTQ